MRRRTAHEMDEWPDVRRPWYQTFWRWVIGWTVIVVVLFAFTSVRRIIDFSGSRVIECQGIVRSLREEPQVVRSNTQPALIANVELDGDTVDVPVDRKVYPNLRVGDKLNLICRVGPTGTKFVQRWRPVNDISDKTNN